MSIEDDLAQQPVDGRGLIPRLHGIAIARDLAPTRTQAVILAEELRNALGPVAFLAEEMRDDARTSSDPLHSRRADAITATSLRLHALANALSRIADGMHVLPPREPAPLDNDEMFVIKKKNAREIVGTAAVGTTFVLDNGDTSHADELRDFIGFAHAYKIDVPEGSRWRIIVERLDG